MKCMISRRFRAFLSFNIHWYILIFVFVVFVFYYLFMTLNNPSYDEKIVIFIGAKYVDLKIEDDFKKSNNGDMLYSKILAYIIYRHFIKAVFDESVKERVCFSVESVRFIYLCDMKTFFEKGDLTLNDRIENLKNWSKQIEYSEENTDYLIYGD